MTIDLTGKRAIVTGASRGLGAAIVARMREAGAEVWAVDRSDEDFAKPRAAFQLWANPKHPGGPEILVNCAGIQGPVGNLIDVDPEDLYRTLQVNLISAIDMCAYTVSSMRKANIHGSIINISCDGACNPRPGYSAYATSKAGLVRFSETIAEECKPYGIRINCVAPGTLGDMGGPADRVRLPTRENEKHAADCVCWLASDASRPITGKLISAVWDPWPELERNLAKSEDMYTLRRIVP